MRGWCPVSILMMLTGATPAQAAPPPASAPRPEQPPARIWREPPGPVQDARIGMPVAGNLHIGVGRFSVAGQARLRPHPESPGRAAEIARPDRTRAAVGLTLRF